MGRRSRGATRKSMSEVGYGLVRVLGIADRGLLLRPIGCAGVAEGGVVETIYRPPGPSWEEMPIDPQGEGRGVVTELLLDAGEGLPGLNQETGEGVAQGVGFAVTQAGPQEDAGPDIVAEGVVPDGLTRRRRENALGGGSAGQRGFGLL